jgi:hypothetical protein
MLPGVTQCGIPGCRRSRYDASFMDIDNPVRNLVRLTFAQWNRKTGILMELIVGGDLALELIVINFELCLAHSISVYREAQY